MDKVVFPKMITDLPEADIPDKETKGYILQGIDRQVVFLDTYPLAETHSPEHSHGEQWGIVVEGEVEFSINGVKKVYKKGDTYHIPEGAPHSGTIKAHVAHIEFFGFNRFKPKAKK